MGEGLDGYMEQMVEWWDLRAFGAVLLAMKRVIGFFLAFASLSWADVIPLEEIKSAEGLPEGTRSLLEGMARFELNDGEAKVLAEKPGAGDAMIEICEKVQEVEHLSQAFMALRLRTDLNAAQQKRVRAMLEPLVGAELASRAVIVQQHGMYLLSKYPGEENEALLVRFLGTRKHWRDPDYTDIAAMALGQMGTPKSLDALRLYAARSKPPEGYLNEGYDAAVKAERLILERAQGKGKTQGEPGGPKPGEPRSAMALYDQLLGAMVGRYGGEDLVRIKETTILQIRKIPGHARELGDRLQRLGEVRFSGGQRDQLFFLLQHTGSPESIAQIGRFLTDERNPDADLPADSGALVVPNCYLAAGAMQRALPQVAKELGMAREGWRGSSEKQMLTWRTWWKEPGAEPYRKVLEQEMNPGGEAAAQTARENVVCLIKDDL
jgi:hypothetical protein